MKKTTVTLSGERLQTPIALPLRQQCLISEEHGENMHIEIDIRQRQKVRMRLGEYRYFLLGQLAL
jgi:hypothetical protein